MPPIEVDASHSFSQGSAPVCSQDQYGTEIDNLGGNDSVLARKAAHTKAKLVKGGGELLRTIAALPPHPLAPPSFFTLHL